MQTKRMEMSDDLHALEKRRKELIAQGHRVAKVAVTREMIDAGAAISPRRSCRADEQSRADPVGETTIGQQAVKEAMIEAHIRPLTTPGS